VSLQLAPCVTTHDLEKYFRSNAAVEVVTQAIVVISFVGDIFCILRDTDPGEVCAVAEITFQGHSVSLKDVD